MDLTSILYNAIAVMVIIGGIMTAAAYLVLLERWTAAWVQMRRGPNRVGVPLTKIRLFGLGQPLADGLKFIFKEEYTPAHVNKRLYLLAPFVMTVSALAVYAVIPFGSGLPINLSEVPLINLLPLASWGWDGPREIPLLLAGGLDVGLIYVFALSSIAVYGVILGGWASNDKYSFLGALRSSAQIIAYELPLGLGILGVVLASGTLRLDRIVVAQAETGLWNVVCQPLGCLVFVIAAFAEAARLPFDLPEAEQELIGGYHTEYSGIKLLLFLTSEFIHMITASFLIVILFLGGWHLPFGLTGSVGMESAEMGTGGEIGLGLGLWRIGVLLIKVLLVVFFFMLVRWSWPRFRFDQLMALAWKVMLPLGLANLVAMACLFEAQEQGWIGTPGRVLAGWVVAAVSLLVMALAGPRLSDNRPRLQPVE